MANDQDLNTVLKFWVSDPLFRVQALSSTTGELQVNRFVTLIIGRIILSAILLWRIITETCWTHSAHIKNRPF
jgi:hypothetical protein